MLQPSLLSFAYNPKGAGVTPWDSHVLRCLLSDGPQRFRGKCRSCHWTVAEWFKAPTCAFSTHWLADSCWWVYKMTCLTVFNMFAVCFPIFGIIIPIDDFLLEELKAPTSQFVSWRLRTRGMEIQLASAGSFKSGLGLLRTKQGWFLLSLVRPSCVHIARSVRRQYLTSRDKCTSSVIFSYLVNVAYLTDYCRHISFVCSFVISLLSSLLHHLLLQFYHLWAIVIGCVSTTILSYCLRLMVHHHQLCVCFLLLSNRYFWNTDTYSNCGCLSRDWWMWCSFGNCCSFITYGGHCLLLIDCYWLIISDSTLVVVSYKSPIISHDESNIFSQSLQLNHFQSTIIINH